MPPIQPWRLKKMSVAQVTEYNAQRARSGVDLMDEAAGARSMTSPEADREKEKAKQQPKDRNRKKAFLGEVSQELGTDEVPTLKAEEIVYSTKRLSELIEARPRSYHEKDDCGDVVHVKIKTSNTWVKVTQWNANCVKATYLREPNTGRWRKSEDRVPVDHYQDLEESAYCVCIVHHENLVLPRPTTKRQPEFRHRAYLHVAPMMDDLRHCTSKQNSDLEAQFEDIKHADAVAWSAILRSKARPPLVPGCRTLVLELFCGALLLTLMASLAGYAVSEPCDIQLDGSILLNPKMRRNIDEQIAWDDPFAVIIPFPCGPWNSWTVVNASKSNEAAESVDAARAEHSPMLKWMVNLAKGRIGKGRIVLLDNGWTSEALNLPEIRSLEECTDGLTGEPFEIVRGDQCMLGQHDWESKMPVRARTAWGSTVPS